MKRQEDKKVEVKKEEGDDFERVEKYMCGDDYH